MQRAAPLPAVEQQVMALQAFQRQIGFMQEIEDPVACDLWARIQGVAGRDGIGYLEAARRERRLVEDADLMRRFHGECLPLDSWPIDVVDAIIRHFSS